MVKKDWLIEPRHYLIPAGFCMIAVLERRFRQMQIYMALKASCRGQLRLTPDIVSEISIMTGAHSRTVKRAIDWLVMREWIGFNPNSGITHIRGFDKILKIEKSQSNAGYWFDIQQIKYIKEFAITARLGEMIHVQRRRLLVEAKDQRGMRSKHTAKTNFPSFYPISVIAMSKILKISIRTASNYRKMADNQGFIKMIENVKPFEDVGANQLNLVREYATNPGHYYSKKGIVWLRSPNLVKVMLRRKKRRNIAKSMDKKYNIY